MTSETGATRLGTGATTFVTGATTVGTAATTSVTGATTVGTDATTFGTAATRLGTAATRPESFFSSLVSVPPGSFFGLFAPVESCWPSSRPEPSVLVTP